MPCSSSVRILDRDSTAGTPTVRDTVPVAPDDLAQILHRVAGSVYVASDLIGRAVAQYMEIASAPDRSVVDKCAEVGLALAGVAQTLEAALAADRLGPAA
jgi:hypothetical protein